jgi:hypothetical protein
MGDSPENDYDRGHLAGGIEERLSSHDRHFVAINGSLERIADEMHAMAMAIQRLADQSIADAATRVTTAAALKDADEARRITQDQNWSPVSRAIALVGAAVAVASLVLGAYLALKR